MCSTSQGFYELVPENLVCECGKGYANRAADKMCRFCREKTVSRAVGKKLGVRHTGDGLGYYELHPQVVSDFENLDEPKGNNQ